MDLITYALCRKGGGGGGSFTPAELLLGVMRASDWSGNTQTVTVMGVESDSIGTVGLLETATDAEIQEARKALITCTAIGTNTVTFKCEKTPSIDINFGVLLPGDSGSSSDEGGVVDGYYNPTDGLFYEESTYTTPIMGEDNHLYVSVDTNKIYRFDGTNFVVVAGGGGGGAAELQNSLTAGITVGGVSAGDSYAAGTTLEKIFNDLLNPVLYPTFTAPSGSISIPGNKILKTGSTSTVTVTATFNRGSINPAYGTSGYRAGAATGYALNGGASQSGNTFSQTVSSTNKQFQVVISYAAGEQPKDSKGGNYSSPLPAGTVTTNKITYEFTMPIYANTTSASTMTELSLVSKSSGSRQFSFPATTTANPECFDMPGDYTVSKIEVYNTLSGKWEVATSQFTATTTTHNDAAGNAVNYNRYTCNYAGSLGARDVKVTWS